MISPHSNGYTTPLYCTITTDWLILVCDWCDEMSINLINTIMKWSGKKEDGCFSFFNINTRTRTLNSSIHLSLLLTSDQLLFSTVQYRTVQYSAVQCSTVQCSTAQYSTVQWSEDCIQKPLEDNHKNADKSIILFVSSPTRKTKEKVINIIWKDNLYFN